MNPLNFPKIASIKNTLLAGLMMTQETDLKDPLSNLDKAVFRFNRINRSYLVLFGMVIHSRGDR
jgi:hypothetical protein